MTVFLPDAGMIPSEDVEVCCGSCGAIYCLPTLSYDEKKRLFECTRHWHDREEMHAVTFVESLVETFPNTRNQLIRGKVDQQCSQLDWAMLQLNAARNTAIDHDAHRAHVQRLAERVAKISREIAQRDSCRESPTEADEEEVSKLLRDNPRILNWLRGVFTIEQVKKRLEERIAASTPCDDFLPCRECDKGWLFISRRCYDSIYHGIQG